MIIRKIPRTSQPPVGVGPNPYWIDQGMVALFDVRQARELISGDFATNRTSLLVARPSGMAGDFSGTANQQYAHRAAYAITGELSIVVVCGVDALTNYSGIIAKEATTTTQMPYEFRLSGSPTDAKINLGRASTGVNERRSSGAQLTAPFDGIIIVTAPVLMQDSATAYVNGVEVSLLSSGGTNGSATDNGTSSVWIGRRPDGATQLDGPIYYVALFNKRLSSSAALSLTQSKWGIYAPQERKIFVEVSSGGVTPTELTTATFGFTAESPQLALVNNEDVATFGFTAQDIQITLGSNLDVTTFGFAAESPQLALINNESVAAFDFVAQSVTAENLGASVNLDVTTFDFVANATQNTITNNLDVGTIGFTANGVQPLLAQDLTVCLFDFVANDAQLANNLELSTATFNFVANAITFPSLPSTGRATRLMLMGVGN